MNTYLMENSEEIQRLERKTDASAVVRCATQAGLRSGMRVIDLCCGAGVTTSVLSDLTGMPTAARSFSWLEYVNAGRSGLIRN